MINVVDECSLSELKSNVLDHSVESRVGELLSSQLEEQVVPGLVGNIVLDSLWLLVSENLESDGSLGVGAVGVIDVGPDSFDVLRGVEVLVDVGGLAVEVTGCVVVVGVTDPHCQHSVSVVCVSLSGLAGSQSSQEVPGGDLSGPSWSWVEHHEPNPESVTVFVELHWGSIGLDLLGEHSLTE